METATIIVIFV